MAETLVSVLVQSDRDFPALRRHGKDDLVFRLVQTVLPDILVRPFLRTNSLALRPDRESRRLSTRPFSARAVIGRSRNQSSSFFEASQDGPPLRTLIGRHGRRFELEDVLAPEIEEPLVEDRLEMAAEEDDPLLVLPFGEQGLVDGVLHADEQPYRSVLALEPESDLPLREFSYGPEIGRLGFHDPFDLQAGKAPGQAVDFRRVRRRLERLRDRPLSLCRSSRTSERRSRS